MRCSTALALVVLAAATSARAASKATGTDPGPLVRALWLVQRYGTANAVNPDNDQRVKGTLFKALGKEGELTLPELGGLHVLGVGVEHVVVAAEASEDHDVGLGDGATGRLVLLVQLDLIEVAPVLGHARRSE